MEEVQVVVSFFAAAIALEIARSECTEWTDAGFLRERLSRGTVHTDAWQVGAVSSQRGAKRTRNARYSLLRAVAVPHGREI